MRKLMRKFTAFLNILSSALMVILMLMTVTDVVLRKWFGLPFSGSYELTMLMLSLIVLFGFGYANDFKEHVVIDMFYEKMPYGMKKFCSVLTIVLSLAITAVLTFVVFRQGIRLMASGGTTFSLRIPLWPFAMIGSVGFLGYFLSIVGDALFIFKDRKVFGHDPG